jgi:mRNA interferase RelE/StbE
VRIAWSETALASAARFISDQNGMVAINSAVAALANEPSPPEAFIRGSYRRLRVGQYRVLYSVEGDVITVIRVDRVS